MEDALTLFRQGNHKTQEAYALMALGNVEGLGRKDAAKQCFYAADIYRGLGMAAEMEMAVANIGWVT